VVRKRRRNCHRDDGKKEVYVSEEKGWGVREDSNGGTKEWVARRREGGLRSRKRGFRGRE